MIENVVKMMKMKQNWCDDIEINKLFYASANPNKLVIKPNSLYLNLFKI